MLKFLGTLSNYINGKLGKKLNTQENSTFCFYFSILYPILVKYDAIISSSKNRRFLHTFFLLFLKQQSQDLPWDLILSFPSLSFPPFLYFSLSNSFRCLVSSNSHRKKPNFFQVYLKIVEILIGNNKSSLIEYN